jgi:hypothetical protein
MKSIRKCIVTDETMRPIAVQIDYADWLEIEQLLNLQSSQPRVADLSRFAGTITLTEDALEYQDRMRGSK